MYMLEMLEAYWYQIQKCRNINALNGPDKFVVWAKSNDGIKQKEWEEKFKTHALAIYPDLREYIKELESNGMDIYGKDIKDLQHVNSQLRQEIRELEKEIEVLAANQKKPRKKKDK